MYVCTLGWLCLALRVSSFFSLSKVQVMKMEKFLVVDGSVVNYCFG